MKLRFYAIFPGSHVVRPRVLRRISQLSNHSTPRSYRSIIQSQHNTSYFEIKAGLKALEFGVMFSFATDNCVLSVVFSSVVFYAFLRFSFWLCGCFLFSCFVSIFRLGAVALCVRHWVRVGGVGMCSPSLTALVKRCDGPAFFVWLSFKLVTHAESSHCLDAYLTWTLLSAATLFFSPTFAPIPFCEKLARIRAHVSADIVLFHFFQCLPNTEPLHLSFPV